MIMTRWGGTPEEDDDPMCAQSYCAQYGLNEAAHYTNPNLYAWQACNEGSPSFTDHFEPLKVEFNVDGLHLTYRAPLTKEGDFGGSAQGNQNSLTIHFGLGDYTEIDAIEVQFIGGELVRFEGPIAVDQRLKLTESSNLSTF